MSSDEGSFEQDIQDESSQSFITPSKNRSIVSEKEDKQSQEDK